MPAVLGAVIVFVSVEVKKSSERARSVVRQLPYKEELGVAEVDKKYKSDARKVDIDPLVVHELPFK